MTDAIQHALEIVKAQASVRPMTEDEIIAMARGLSQSLSGLSGDPAADALELAPACDPKAAIKEKSITCLECGKAFKLMNKKHLAAHGLTPAQYREKWGYKKGIPLVCKGLQRVRRKKMKDMQLWTKRTGRKNNTEAVQ